MTSIPDSGSVKVYTVNGAASGSSSSLPDWLTRKRAVKGKGKRAAREAVEGTIELIQHFEYPEASNRIRTTRDGHHAMATGTYKPHIKVWDLDQLALKFERHSDAENVDFIILSDDWTKSLHLQNDRTLELHTQGGLHHRTRIPRFGRALAYHFPSCDALVGAAGAEVYRLNLEQGRFMQPLVLQGDPDSAVGADEIVGVNAVDVNPAHQLLAFGTEGAGTVEFWDPRSRARAGVLRLPRARLEGGAAAAAPMPGLEDLGARAGIDVTALASRADGLSYAVGTSTGHTLLYDIRSARPFAVKDQGYGLPVKTLTWLEGGSRMAGDGLVLSADKKVIKIWDRNSPTTNFTSITPAADVNDVHAVPGSGLLMCANEGIRMTAFFVPQLGPAPRWCSFLENITEEMEDQTSRTAYEDYKFVERDELARLGLDSLVGTPALKPYMHGYFLSLKLYDAARVIARPFEYAEHRARLVQDKIDKMAESRIRARKDAPGVKVNKALAERVRREEDRERKREERKAERAAARQKDKEAAAAGGEVGADEEQMEVDAEGDADAGAAAPRPTLLSDSRFSALFEDPEFQVDEGTREFALMHPSAAAQRQGHASDASGRASRAKTAVEEEEDESDKVSSDGLGESDSDSEADGKGKAGDDSDDSSDAGDLGFDDPRAHNPEQRARRAREYEAEGKRRRDARTREPRVRLVPVHAQGGKAALPGADKNATFGQRRSAGGSASASRRPGGDVVKTAAGGGLEISWVPSASASRDDDGDSGDDRGGRGAQRKKGKGPERRKGVEVFGAGMEKGVEERGGEGSESERKGRTERRKGIRSGSKNVIFRRS